MSATVIDQLIVTLGLDGTGYKKGTDAAAVQTKKLRDDAGQTAKVLKTYGKSGGEFFGEISKRALEFFAIIAAGRGAEQLFTQAVTVGNATKILAQNTGTTVKNASALANALTIMGLSGDAAAASLSGIAAQQQAILHGNPGGGMGLSLMAQRAHIKWQNPDGSPIDPAQILEQLAPYFQGMSAQSAQYQGQLFGIPADMVTLLRTLGASGIQKAIATDASQTNASTQAASNITNAVGFLEIQIDAVSSTLMTLAAPTLTQGLKDFALGVWAINQVLQGKLPASTLLGIIPGAPAAVQSFQNTQNNNPGNLRYVGQPHAHAGPNGIAIFDTPQAGVDALTGQLALYGQRGLDTVSEIVTRYEGGTDPNDTGAGNPDHNNIAAYINFVKGKLGVGANDPLDMSDPNTLAALSAAISMQEGTAAAKFHYGSPMLLLHQQRHQIPASVNAILTKLRAEQTINVGGVTINTPSSNPKQHGKTAARAIREAIVTQANVGLM